MVRPHGGKIGGRQGPPERAGTSRSLRGAHSVVQNGTYGRMGRSGLAWPQGRQNKKREFSKRWFTKHTNGPLWFDIESMYVKPLKS